MLVIILIIISFVVAFLVFAAVIFQGTKVKTKRLNVKSLDQIQERPILGLGIACALVFFVAFWIIYFNIQTDNIDQLNADLRIDSVKNADGEGIDLDFISFQKIVKEQKTSNQKNVFLNFKFGMTKSQFEHEHEKLKKNMTEYGPGIYTYKVQLEKSSTVYEMAIIPSYYKGLMYKLSLTAYADFNTTTLLGLYFEDKYKSKPYIFRPNGTYIGKIWIDGNKFIKITTVQDDYPGVTSQLKYGQIEYYDSNRFISKTIEERNKALQDSTQRVKLEEKRIKETGTAL